MPTAITPLANITLSSSASTVTFSSISGSYRDLYLVATYTMTGANYPIFRYNTDSSAIYYWTYAVGNGSTTSAAANSGDAYIPFSNSVSASTTEPTVVTVSVLDYAQTDKHKPGLHRFNRAGASTEMTASRYGSTSAITAINILGNGGSFAAGSTFALYGVSA